MILLALKELAPLFLGAATNTTPLDEGRITDIAHRPLPNAEVIRTQDTSASGQKTTCLNVESRDGLREAFCSSASKEPTVSVEGAFMDPETTSVELTTIRRERGVQERCATLTDLAGGVPRHETYCKPGGLGLQ